MPSPFRLNKGWTGAVLLAALLLAGCSAEVPLPFVASLPPPPPGPPPAYPTVETPNAAGKKDPVLSEQERAALEAQLKKLATSREQSARDQIEKSE